MNPFDLKSVLLAKHAQHVVLIHFPIALFLVGVAFDLIAQRTKKQAVAAAAHLNLILAAVSTLPVLVTGVMAWQWALGGPKLKGILLQHMVLACVSSILVLFVGWLHFRAIRSPGAPLPRFRLPIEVIAAALIALTAHLGGFLSGVNIPS
jgi:uncharacterized membrane protein